MIHLNLKSYEQALNDADIACKLQPNWLKGHLKKAQALVNLGKTDDALKEYLYCLALDSGNNTAKSEAQKLLLKMLSPGHSQGDLPEILQIIPHHPTRIKGSLTTNSLSTSDYSSNTQRLYRGHMEYKKSVMFPEEVDSCECKSSWKFKQKSENKTDVEKKRTSSAEAPVKLPPPCNTLKRKLSSDDEGRMLEGPCKLQKRVRVNNGDQDSVYVDPSDLDCSLCMSANIFRSALQIIEGTCTYNRHYSITEIQFKTDIKRSEGPARKLTNYEEKGRHERPHRDR
ncbi:unnamed protein product [Ranitomeya imitator]|uniref:Tetratricopeptide repeat protein n=1 Tax=Ranitomeya imitator TaxID=111125 RepID=A0ABN9M9T1_9NEOB|nr:unnamed protein product [Ranitomeya imitator]